MFREILSIADFTIKLQSDSPFSLEEGYLPFIREKEEQDTDVHIHCYSGLPKPMPRKDTLLFEAQNEHQKFYSIYRSGSDLLFEIYNQQTRDEIQQIAILDSTFSTWRIYALPSSDNELLPLKYPLGPIIMYYLTVKSDAVMIHASGIFDGNKGRIFTGFSGRGKSTMSKLWAAEGSMVINDDRLIIRKRDDGYYIYNTPMYYRDIPKTAPLHAIHLISHSPDNRINKVAGAMAVSKVLAFCIQNNFDKRFILNHLNFLSGLCGQIPVYDTGFVPDVSVVGFIKKNEKRQL